MIPQLLIQPSIWLLFLLPVLKADAGYTNAAIARHGCQDTCGNVSIAYPFGIGPNCFLDSWFEIKCKASPDSNGSVKPFLAKFKDVELIEVILQAEGDYVYQPKVIIGIPPLNVCRADTQHLQMSSIDLRGSPFNFSTQYNDFLMDGCPGSVLLVNESESIVTGCGTVCHNNNSAMSTKNCYGVHCCQTPLPSESSSYIFTDSLYYRRYYFRYLRYHSSLQFYQVKFNPQSSGERQSCLVATLIKNDSVVDYVRKLSTSAPVVLYWSWISKLEPDSVIDPLAICEFQANITYCRCKGWYSKGNPYVVNGCQVPEICKDCPDSCEKDGNSYHCDNSSENPFTNVAAILVYVGLAIVLWHLLLHCGCQRLYHFIKRRRKTERRVKFFKTMLQQQLSSNEGGMERTQIFTKAELRKATDNFNENRILGQGGQGTVYKGMLTDGRLVAIKKSKLLDESQMEQFINEVVILSQINHRNVVKILGCCLQTEVPLLVYEFVPNGTLAQHIHNPSEDFVINWAMRLKITADSAGAIAYLHSSSSSPIYHRDIKSSNILLDDKYKAKVSDFGLSRTIAIDQTHLTTLVQGTLGYLDPEYYQTNQFTEKSDVYSFGVVILELLTGKQPIYRDRNMDQKNLASEFLFLMQNSQLSEILDPKIVEEAKEEELIAVVNLAKCCLSSRGELRPTMKEVAMTLEMTIKSPVHVTLNPESYMKEGVEEPMIVEISDRELRKPWSSMDFPAEASSSSCVELSLLSNTLRSG